MDNARKETCGYYILSDVISGRKTAGTLPGVVAEEDKFGVAVELEIGIDPGRRLLVIVFVGLGNTPWISVMLLACRLLKSVSKWVTV